MGGSRALFLLFVAAAFACTSSPPKKMLKDSISSVSKDETRYVTEMNFNQGSARLNKSARSKLVNLFQQLSAHHKVRRAKVITWADREDSLSNSQELTDSEKKLVENRNRHIEDYLHRLSGKIKVEKFSVTKRPSDLSQFFSAEDAPSIVMPEKAAKSIVIFN